MMRKTFYVLGGKVKRHIGPTSGVMWNDACPEHAAAHLASADLC